MDSLSIGRTAAGASAPDAQDPQGQPSAQLREAAAQMEALFYQQLFAAMRDTLPESDSGLTRTSQEMFGPMMDEHLSRAATERLSELGRALLRELGEAQASHTAPPATPTSEDR